MKHWSGIIVQMSNIKLMAIEKVNVMSEKTSHQNNMDDIGGYMMQNNMVFQHSSPYWNCLPQ